MLTDTRLFKALVLAGVLIDSAVAFTTVGMTDVLMFDVALGMLSALAWRLNREPATIMDVPPGAFAQWERNYPVPAFSPQPQGY